MEQVITFGVFIIETVWMNCFQNVLLDAIVDNVEFDGGNDDDGGGMLIYILLCSVCLCVTNNYHFLLGVSVNHLNNL